MPISVKGAGSPPPKPPQLPANFVRKTALGPTVRAIIDIVQKSTRIDILKRILNQIPTGLINRNDGHAVLEELDAKLVALRQAIDPAKEADLHILAMSAMQFVRDEYYTLETWGGEVYKKDLVTAARTGDVFSRETLGHWKIEWAEAPKPPTVVWQSKAIVGGAVGEHFDPAAGIFLITLKGARGNDEDSVGLLASGNKRVLLTADGMGGHSHGEVASRLAVETIIEAVKAGQKLPAASTAGHQKIAADPMAKGARGMCTTLSAVFIESDEATIVRAGDSPIYLLDTDGKLNLLALPQIGLIKDLNTLRAMNLVVNAELDRLESALQASPTPPYNEAVIKAIADCEAAIKSNHISGPIGQAMINVLSGLGCEKMPDLSVAVKVSLKPGQIILACSDGFDLSPDEIRAIKARNLPFDQFIRALATEAERLGRKGDNVTIAAYHHGPLPTQPDDIPSTALARLAEIRAIDLAILAPADARALLSELIDLGRNVPTANKPDVFNLKQTLRKQLGIL